MNKRLKKVINLKLRFRLIAIVLVSFLITPLMLDYSVYSQNLIPKIELIKKWEIQIPQDDFVRPRKLILDNETNTVWANYLETLYNIDISTGKVNFEYNPPDQQLIDDFIVKDEIVYLTTTDRELKNDSCILKLRLSQDSQETLWCTKIPYSDFSSIQHIEYGQILVSCKYIVDEENGNLESLCSIFDRVNPNTLCSSSNFPKENTMYWFVSPWKDIFQLNLPFLWVLENKTHLNIPEDVTEFCPFFSVLENGNFLIASCMNKSIFIFNKDGEIEKKIRIPSLTIRFDDSSVIKIGLNKFVDTSIYKNNYIISSPMSIKEGFTFHLFNFENDTVLEKIVKTDCSYPFTRTLSAFWNEKLFILAEESKYKDGYSTIHIFDTSNLDSLAVLREDTSKIIEPEIGKFSLRPFLPFTFLGESDSSEIIVMYQNKVCLYEIIEN